MFKKIVCNVALIMALLLAVFMFSSCIVPDVPDNGLAAYKTTAQAELEAYAESKGEGNYTAENWAAIEGFVADGKAAVDAAADRAGVDAAVAAAKEAIDDVSLKEELRLGTFYSLQQAYDEGLLTQDDLKNIAYYHHGSMEYDFEKLCEEDLVLTEGEIEIIRQYQNENAGFIPAPKIPEVLSAETEQAIKEATAFSLRAQTYSNGTSMYPNAAAEGVKIKKYHGTYHNCAAVVIDDSYRLYYTGVIYPGIMTIIDGVIFFDVIGQNILIYKIPN